MTSEAFSDALTLLPEDLVARADEFRSRKPTVIPLKRYAALAACFAVLLTSAIYVHSLRQRSAVTEMAAAVPFDVMEAGEAEAVEEAPRMEAAMGSQKNAMADSAIPYTCVETPVNVHSTASFAHGPAPSLMTSREDLEGYRSKWERLYLLDALGDACEIYDEDWFSSHDLLLIAVDSVTGPCAVTDMVISDGGCVVTVALGEDGAEPTNYHLLLPLEKNTLTDPAKITVIYNSDTTD